MRAPTLPLIPIPAKVTPKDGSISLGASTQIEAPDALRPLAERLRDMLRPATGLALPIVTSARGARIALALMDRIGPPGDGAYRLVVAPASGAEVPTVYRFQVQGEGP